jgi:hypothetical protein
LFSQYIKYLIEKLQFIKIVFYRFLIILFRKRKRIELLYLNYDKEHLFESSYIVINYRFRNAIYYRFGKHITLEKKIKIFNIKNFENEFDLVVFGFFQKKTYRIQFEPKLALNTDTFKATISNLTVKLIEQEMPKLAHPKIYSNIKQPIINTKKIKINNNSYNQNEYI